MEISQVNLREYFENLMAERHNLYETKFKAAEVAVAAALAAQEKSTHAAFLSSEKAIVKAETAQHDYNARSNEFRATLDDQSKTLMSRTEVNAITKNIEDKMAVQQENHNKDVAALRMDIASLRESRSEGTGKDDAAHAAQKQSNWTVGNIVIIGIAVVGWVLAFSSAFTYFKAQ